MNRRAFLKLIGATALATVLPLPKTPVEVSKIVVPTPGIPWDEVAEVSRLGWVMHHPRTVIINDNVITKLRLIEPKENSIG